MRLMFAVSTAGVCVSCDLSAAVSRAYDILAADGVEPDRAAELAVAAERAGRDPVRVATHLVGVRQALRG